MKKQPMKRYVNRDEYLEYSGIDLGGKHMVRAHRWHYTEKHPLVRTYRRPGDGEICNVCHGQYAMHGETVTVPAILVCPGDYVVVSDFGGVQVLPYWSFLEMYEEVTDD